MTTKAASRPSPKEIWKNVADFANDLAADLVKFLLILACLSVVSWLLHLLKVAGLMDEVYLDIIEKLDFAGKLAVILILVIDFPYKLFVSLRKESHDQRRK